MKSFLQAAAICGLVICLVTLLSVSSCHAGDIVMQTPAGVAIDVPKIVLPSWQWIVLGIAAFIFLRGGGTIAGLMPYLQAVLAWLKNLTPPPTPTPAPVVASQAPGVLAAPDLFRAVQTVAADEQADVYFETRKNGKLLTVYYGDDIDEEADTEIAGVK